MKILVIVPTHDRRQFLNDALDSLRHQTRPADHVIVTGNVMPSNPFNLCANSAGRYACAPLVEFERTDDELAARINRAVQSSDCDAFLILSDDDKLEPTYIEKTSIAMESFGADAVCTIIRLFGQIECMYSRRVMPISGELNVSSLIRKRTWEIAGGFHDVAYFDADFFLACREHGRDNFVCLYEPLFMYRIHGDQDGHHITGEDHERNVATMKARHPKGWKDWKETRERQERIISHG